MFTFLLEYNKKYDPNTQNTQNRIPYYKENNTALISS